MLCQRWPRQPIRAWLYIVSYRYSISCSVTEILHVNPEHILANLRGPRPTLWQLEALPLKRLGHPPNASLLLPWIRCVPKTQLDRPTRLATIHSRPRQTDHGPLWYLPKIFVSHWLCWSSLQQCCCYRSRTTCDL